MEDYTIWTTFHKDQFVKEYNLREDEHHKLYPTHKDIALPNINMMNPVYSEMVCMWCVWKNNLKSDYVGFEHYRRRLDIDHIPEEGHCYVFDEITLNETIYKQYCRVHNKKDMDIVLRILEETYGKDNVYAKHIRESKTLIPFCTFMMSWNDFTLLCGYMFGIAEKYSKRIRIVGYGKEALNRWKMKAIEDFKGISWKYQTRVLAYLMERLISAWISAHLEYHCVGIGRGTWLKPDMTGNNMTI